MIKVKVYGRAGSTYMKIVRGWMGNHPLASCNVALNYGLQGDKARQYERRNPNILRLPILNHKQFGNKYEQIKVVERAGVPVPESWHPRDFKESMEFQEDTFIVKPYYSLGGRGIKVWNGNPVSSSKYIQRKMNNRRYEMRVHACAWVDPANWIFQKRVHEDGENVLAWNHHNGGKFITVNNPTDPLHDRVREATKKSMKALGYQFGAADFIIQNPGTSGEPLKHFFLEWNLACGWTLPRISDYYEASFKALANKTMDELEALTDGVYPWDESGVDDVHSRFIVPTPPPEPRQNPVPAGFWGSPPDTEFTESDTVTTEELARTVAETPEEVQPERITPHRISIADIERNIRRFNDNRRARQRVAGHRYNYINVIAETREA